MRQTHRGQSAIPVATTCQLVQRVHAESTTRRIRTMVIAYLRTSIWVLAIATIALLPNPADAQTTNNSPTWSSPSPLGQGALTDISCPWAAFCMATDFYGNAYTYDGSTWTTTNIDGSITLEAVSCVSPTFCVAGDHNGRALFFNGSAWSAPQQIVPSLAGDAIKAISCAATTFCAASDNNGDVVVYNGSSWSPPAILDPVFEGTVTGLSCPYPGFCMAVDQNGKAYTYSDSGWTEGVVVDANAFFFGVSCVSPSFCIAADYNFGAVYTYTGSWSGPNYIDKVTYPSLLAISCASTRFCVALDGNYGNALMYDGSNWSAATIDAANPFNLTAVSCPTETFCVGIDPRNALVYSSAFMLNKIVDLSLISPGQRDLTYSIAVINRGASSVTGIAVADTLPAGVSLVGSTSTQGSCSGNRVIACSINSLAAGATAKITLTVTANWIPGKVTNTATASSNEYPASSSNPATTIVRSASDLAIVKTAAPGRLSSPGDALAYTLSVQNKGPYDVLDVQVIDNLPPHVVVQSVSATQGGCAGKQSISCNLGEIGNQSASSVTITVIPLASSAPLLSDALVNTASVTALFNDDPNLSNNSSSVSVNCPYCTTQAATNLTLTSSLNPSLQGQSVTFTAKITTNAPVTPSNESVDFMVDGNGATVVTVPLDSSGSASYSTSSLTPGAHTIAVRYAGDQFYAPSSATLAQTVTTSSGGGPTGTCACAKSGAYGDPSLGLDPGNDPSSSPSHKYSVVASVDNTSAQTTLSVMKGSTVVFSPGPLPITTHWGFSPDDDRFVYHFLDPNSNVDEIYVYDVSVAPARKLVYNAVAQSGDRLQFSPSGKYFIYTALLGQATSEIWIYRVQGVATQTEVLDSGAIEFAVGHGEDDFGELTSGFSPDNPETSFVYAYVDGQSNFQWNLVNLAAGHTVKTLSLTTIASFWQFDPCGDVIALVSQPSADQAQIDLYSTASGVQLASDVIPSLSVSLLANAGQQEVQYNGQTTVLTTDPGCSPNTPTGSNVAVQPKAPSTGTSPATVTFPAVSQAGQTTLSISNTGPAPAENFELGTPPTYYDISTTAIFTPPATVCISYAGVKYNNASAVRLYHYENGNWVDHTTSNNTSTLIVCGKVNSFSPFALFEPVDNIAPTTSVVASPQPNAAGWNNQDVTIGLSAVDNPGGSGVQAITYSISTNGATPVVTTVNATSAQFAVATEGTTTISFLAVDNANNIETAHTLTIKLDKTPPAITGTPTPLPNSYGWNNTDVTVHFMCSDSFSGVQPGSTTVDTTVSTEGVNQSVSGSCRDIAGNTASATVSGMNIDKTAPTIIATRTPQPNSYGWNNSDVTVSFACSDALSGLAPGSPSDNTVVSTDGANQSVSGSCSDLAGNVARATVANINIDKTPPKLACGASPNILWPPNHKLVNVSTTVNVSDSLSGPAGFELLSIASNEPVDADPDIVGWTFGAASTSGQFRAERLGGGTGRVYTLNYKAFDKAGNSSVCTPTVSVPHDQGSGT